MKAVGGLGLILALLAMPANAQIVKCRTESGQLVYTEKNCPAGTQALDLAETLPASPRGAPNAAVKPPALSARAQRLKSYVFECVHRGRVECDEYYQMYRACLDKRNRWTPDCKALVELLPLLERESAEETIGRSRAGCLEAASNDECRRETCAVLASLEPDDEQIYACAAARGFPSAKSWVLIHEQVDQAGKWTGTYVCIPRYRFLGDIGEPVWQRGRIAVEAQISGGRPTGSFILLSREREVFASREAAADAGCARQNAQLAEKEKRDAQAPGAGS